MHALSIRQPYAELILRGVKTIEYRSRSTRIVGERFYLYASGKWPARKRGLAEDTLPVKQSPWSLDLAMPGDAVPPWMVELANGLRLFPHELPTGVIVGSAIIEKVTRRDDGMYQWHLTGVERAKHLRKPKGHPQPVWFTPF